MGTKCVAAIIVTFSIVPTTCLNYTDRCQEVDCPPGKVFHCLVDDHWKQLQKCLQPTYIPKGKCAYYNLFGNMLHVRNCSESMMDSCPTKTYLSNMVSNYSACMMQDYAASMLTTTQTTRTTQEGTSMMSSTKVTHASDIPTTERNPSVNKAAKSNQEGSHLSGGGVAGIVLTVLVVIGLVVAAVIILRRKGICRKQQTNEEAGQKEGLEEREPLNVNNVQNGTIIDVSNQSDSQHLTEQKKNIESVELTERYKESAAKNGTDQD